MEQFATLTNDLISQLHLQIEFVKTSSQSMIQKRAAYT